MGHIGELIKPGVLCLLFVFLSGCDLLFNPPSPAIRLRQIGREENQFAFEIVGLSQEELACLNHEPISQQKWRDIFAVYVGNELPEDKSVPPMLGSYEIGRTSIRFTPQFSLQPGLTYAAIFHSDSDCIQPAPPADKKDKGNLFRVQTVVTIPAAKQSPKTVVEAVYPNAVTLPENLLKFYVHFSGPMSRGTSYGYIHLLDDTGKAVELPFLELDEELWDPDYQRLTVLLDPGRIKRDLKPNRDVGPALQPGRRYTLVIDADWPDADGVRLKKTFREAFQVGPFDATPPQPQQWTILPVESQTRKPLRIKLPEPMDHALLQRCLTIMDPTGQPVPGIVAISKRDTSWFFTPDRPWQSGNYTLHVATILEDLAGNSVGRLFEVDLSHSPQSGMIPDSIEIPLPVK